MTSIPFLNELLANFRPPPQLTGSQWAEGFRFISEGTSANAGRWDNNFAPFQREIMDAMTDEQYEMVVVQSPAQIGKTEMVNNVIGYFIHLDPCPIMIVHPSSRPMAESWSNDKFSPMLRDTPVLRDKVVEAKSRDSGNKILYKKFDGGYIVIAGANSAAQLRQRSIRVIIFDDIDGYPVYLSNEGDPVALGEARTKTFFNRKKIYASTPTLKDFSRIEKLLAQTDHRVRLLPCPHCGIYQRMNFFDNVVCDRDEENRRIPETAKYKCSNDKCNKFWDYDQILEADQSGKWVPTKAPANPRNIGFEVDGLYTPWSSLEELVRKYNEARDGGRETFKTFMNVHLGKLWEEKAFKLSSEVLFSRVENYENFIPKDVLVLNAGVDVQGDRIEGLVAGWGIGFECWLIDYFIIYEDPEKEEAWAALDNYLMRTYAHPAGVNLRLTSAFIDSGYKSTTVYKYTKAREALKIYSSKGKGEAGLPILSRASKDRRIGAKFFTIGTWEAKDTLAFRLNKKEPGPGYVHFPNRGLFTIEFFRQLTAERAVTKYKNNVPYRAWEVINKGARNEALDNMVLILANIELINPNFPKIKQSFEEAIERKKSEKPKKQRQQRPGNNWVTGY